MLKVEDLYSQQLRIHAWQFCNGRLPQNQASLLQRISDVHSYSTRAAGSGLAATSRDTSSLSYRVSREWALIPDNLKSVTSQAAFKRRSRSLFLRECGQFECKQTTCRVCAWGPGIGAGTIRVLTLRSEGRKEMNSGLCC